MFLLPGRGGKSQVPCSLSQPKGFLLWPPLSPYLGNLFLITHHTGKSSDFLFISGAVPVPATAFERHPNSTLANSGHQLNTGCGTSLELMVVLLVLVASQAYPFLCSLSVGVGWSNFYLVAFLTPNLDYGTKESVPWQALRHCQSVSHHLSMLS